MNWSWLHQTIRLYLVLLSNPQRSIYTWLISVKSLGRWSSFDHLKWNRSYRNYNYYKTMLKFECQVHVWQNRRNRLQGILPWVHSSSEAHTNLSIFQLQLYCPMSMSISHTPTEALKTTCCFMCCTLEAAISLKYIFDLCTIFL